MDLSKHFPIVVDEDFTGYRLDRFLAESFTEISRARWVKLIDKKIFQISGQLAESSTRIKTGDEITCLEKDVLKKSSEPETLEPSVSFHGDIPKIIFEDEHLLVINKPVGLAVHPGAGLEVDRTVVGWLLHENKIQGFQKDDLISWDQELLEEKRPGIVHRLDRGTSGLLVIAKNPTSHQLLSEQFADRSAGRLYWAVVTGKLEDLKTKRPRRVDELAQRNPSPIGFSVGADGLHSLATFIERDPAHRTRFRVSQGEGRHCLTYFREVSTGAGNLSLLELKLGTGRTHQIRVHLSFLGYPVLGDENYGGVPSTRLWLHAHSLHFTHPKTKLKCSFEAPWSEEETRWLREQGIKIKSVF